MQAPCTCSLLAPCHSDWWRGFMVRAPCHLILSPSLSSSACIIPPSLAPFPSFPSRYPRPNSPCPFSFVRPAPSWTSLPRLAFSLPLGTALFQFYCHAWMHGPQVSAAHLSTSLCAFGPGDSSPKLHARFIRPPHLCPFGICTS